jgi:hypothetical protein
MTSISSTPLLSIPPYSYLKTHRIEIDPPRLGPNISLSELLPSPAWASLPSPPMSGSPPPEDRPEPQQLAGQRRKRSDTPTPTAAAIATIQQSPGPQELPTQRQGAYTELGPAVGGSQIHPAPYAATYPTSQPFGYGPNVTPIPGPAPIQMHFGPGQISPRATRKTKAHVASACVNCKKKHLRCDNARPCNRCTATGKEVRHCSCGFDGFGSQCDVEHLFRC